MTRIIVLDIETTVEFLEDIDEETGKIKKSVDNSPFNPKNKIVTVHWRTITTDDKEFILDNTYTIGDAKHSVFHHNDCTNTDSRQELDKDLADADIFVAHNAKYDIMYLLESGFIIPPEVYCTMIGEYIQARGKEVALSLEAIAIRRNVEQKKLDTTKKYFDAGVGYEAMPLPIVLEYGDADVLSTCYIYLQQMEEWSLPKNKTLVNIVSLMNEMLLFLVEIERNGIMIDLPRLEQLKIDYTNEREKLIADLMGIAQSVMGDYPINLGSGVDLSKIVYSREVAFKERHNDIFNIGVDPRTGKKKYPPYMTDSAFRQAVRTTTRVIKKKTAEHCELCHGNKTIRKHKKNGDPFKKPTKCPRCGGMGYTLTDADGIAGLRLVPERASDASAHGFSVSKDQFDRLIAQAEQKGNLTAIEFLKKKKRLNAVNTYLNSFVEGILRWTRGDNRLHAWFNQCIAKTGRLSSSHP